MTLDGSIHAPADLARQARRHRRDPVPDRLPADDPRERRRRPRDGQGDPRRLQPRAGDAVAQGRRDARRVLELRGHRPRAAAAASRRSCGWRSSACRPTTSWSSSPAARTSTRSSPPSCGASCAPPREGHKRLREHPEVGVDALLKVDPGLDRGLQTDVVSATLPVFFPTDKDKPFGWQEPERVGGLRRLDVRAELLKRPPDAAKALTNEFLPGEGLAPGSTATP